MIGKGQACRDRLKLFFCLILRKNITLFENNVTRIWNLDFRVPGITHFSLATDLFWSSQDFFIKCLRLVPNVQNLDCLKRHFAYCPTSGLWVYEMSKIQKRPAFGNLLYICATKKAASWSNFDKFSIKSFFSFFLDHFWKPVVLIVWWQSPVRGNDFHPGLSNLQDR